jgi:hypothetical protein
MPTKGRRERTCHHRQIIEKDLPGDKPDSRIQANCDFKAFEKTTLDSCPSLFNSTESIEAAANF